MSAHGAVWVRRFLGFTACMLSRRQVEHLAARGAELATARRVRIVAQLLLAAGLVFVLLRTRSIWHDSNISFDRVSWPSLAGALALAAIAVTAAAFVWLAILRRLGEAPQPRWAGIYLQAQLGKYIPGSFWQYAGRAVSARGQAISWRTTTVSTGVELAAAVLAAAVLASLAGSLWLWTTAAPCAAVALALGWRLNRTRTAMVGATAVAAILYVLIWALMGLAFWLTARALISLPFSSVFYYTGAFSIAWLAGLVAFFAPGGIGVREAVLVGLLHARIGTADAALVASASRAVLTAVDVAAAAAGVFLLRKTGRPKDGTVLRRRTDGAASDAKR
jgi:glycosyltransferase 2 family protein